MQRREERAREKERKECLKNCRKRGRETEEGWQGDKGKGRGSLLTQDYGRERKTRMKKRERAKE